MTFDKVYKKITNIVLSVMMIVGLFTVNASVDSAKYEVKAEGTSATLTTGTNFNIAITTLAGDSSPTTNTTNSNITAFARSTTPAPASAITSDISSTNDGSIVAWFDNGTIYWYSSADVIYLNTNFSAAFMKLTGITELDLHDFDISRNSSTGSLVQGCSNLKKIILDGWAPNTMGQLGGLLYDCPSVNEVSAKDWKIPSMFQHGFFRSMSWSPSVPSTIDVSGWDLTNATNIMGLFAAASSTQPNLKTIYSDADWDLPNSIVTTDMFYGLTGLVGGAGTAFDSSKTTGQYAKIDGGESNSGYFTSSIREPMLGYTITYDANGGYFRNDPSHTINTVTYNFTPGADGYDSEIVNGEVLTPVYPEDGWPFLEWYRDQALTKRFDIRRPPEGENLTVYAKYRNPNSYLTTGKNFNQAIKRLSGQNTATYSTENTAIKAFERSTTPAPSGAKTADISSTNDGSIVVWFDNGTIYWYSEADNVYMNNDSSAMFNYCRGLTSLDLSSFNTSNVTNMNCMFFNCDKLTTLEVSNFDTSNVTDMSSMFSGCRKLTSLDVSNFDTSKVTDMSYMFDWCHILPSLDVSNFDTSNVTSMNYMFNQCSELDELDVSNFNTSNVILMNGMFAECCDLTSLDLSNFNTAKVTNMRHMFGNCHNITSLDLTNFDTSNVTDMSSMFWCCGGLTSLDVSSFDTSNVTTMKMMFYHCGNLITLDASSFDTSNVTNMEQMFHTCADLVTIYVSDLWNTEKVTKSGSMFFDNSKLVGEVGTVYDSSHIDKEYACIDEYGTPGYLTYKIPSMSPETEGQSWVVTNEPYHNFNLLKTSSYDGTAVQGAVFRLSGESDYGTVVDKTVTSEASGLVSFTNLEPGTYLLAETSAPEHYLLDDTPRIVTIRKNGIVSISGLIQDGTSFPVINQRLEDDQIVITKKWRDGLIGTAAANRAAPIVDISTTRPGHGYKIIYNANGGFYGSDTSATTNTVTYNFTPDGTAIIEATNYSHTANIDDTGKKNSNYGNSWTNANIAGTDRGDTSKAHVVSIPGSSELTVDLYFNGESANYDWVSIWKGSHPEYTAASNYSSTDKVDTTMGAPNNNNKYGGYSMSGVTFGTYTVNGNTLANVGHITLTIPGDTVTFGFKSDGSGVGQGYGYYAIVHGSAEIDKYAKEVTAGTELTPNSSTEGYVLEDWYLDPECTIPFDETFYPTSRETTVYAKYKDGRVFLTTGQNFNQAIKRLAGNSSATHNMVYEYFGNKL